MELIIANLDIILIVVVAICGMGFATYKWLSQPSSKQKEQIRVVLLQLVIQAEKELGGNGTGAIKRSIVISKLYSQFTWLKWIPVKYIDLAIDESLVQMRKLLESNEQVKKIVKGE